MAFQIIFMDITVNDGVQDFGDLLVAIKKGRALFDKEVNDDSTD